MTTLFRPVTAVLVAVLLAVPAAPASPQPAPADTAAPDTLFLEGRVLRGDAGAPVPDQTVVLHRVAPEGGRAVDSVRTGTGGGFAFRFVPAGSVVHLATARYDGVLYMGPAVHGGRVPDEYAVRVWEARPAGPADTVRIRRRTLVLTPGEGDLRVMDVVDASAGAERTLSAPGGEGRPWWGVRLPDVARDVQVLPGGVEAGAVQVDGGRARVSASIPPRGVRLVLGYRVPDGRSLVLDPGPTTGRLEVVARGTPDELTVEGLRSAGTSTVQGREVRRWVSPGTGAGPVRITAAGPAGGGVPAAAWIAAAVGLLAAVGAFWSWRTGGG